MQLAIALNEAGLPSEAVALRGDDAPDRLPLASLGHRGRSPSALRHGRRLARDVDVVIGHGSDTLLAGAAITWGTSRPFIYQLIGDPRFWGDVRLGQLRVGWPLRRAAAVVALWPAAAEALSAMYDIEPEAVHVIPNGRDATHFRPPSPSERAQARAGLGLGPDDRVACWIGALSWEKQPLLAIEAARAAPGTRLVIAGDGPEATKVAAGAEAAPGVTSVLGSVDDVRSVYWASDLLLMTSRTEGLPGVLVEAALCGLPAVAPDVGGIGGQVDRSTGALVPADASASDYAAAIDTVLEDRAARGEVMRRRCAAGYSMATTVDAWRDLLTAVAGSGTPT